MGQWYKVAAGLGGVVAMVVSALSYFPTSSQFDALAADQKKLVGTVQNLVDSDKLRMLQGQLHLYQQNPDKYKAEIDNAKLQIAFLKCKLYKIGCTHG